MYDQLNLDQEITLTSRKPNITVRAGRGDRAATFRTQFGAGAPASYKEHKGGPVGAVGANGAKCEPFVTCAAVVCVYTRHGQVLGTSIYHAFSGDFADGYDPLGGTYNPSQVGPRDVYVVFASTVGKEGSLAHPGVDKYADGVFELVNTMRIPLGNVCLLFSSGGGFGANDRGDVGMAPEPYWANGDLSALLPLAVADAQNAYNQQFAPGQTKIGFMGRVHDKDEAAGRVNALSQQLGMARNDWARLDAVRTLLDGPHTYKAGSLKLNLVQALWDRLRPQANKVVTPQSAAVDGRTLIDGIRNGTS